MRNRTSRVRYTIIAFLAAMALLHGIFFWHARHLIATRYPDFTAFYAAGTIVRTGMGHELYNPAIQIRIEREVIGRASTIPPLPFLRPPWEALAFAPLTFLGYVGAFCLWNAVGISFLVLWVRALRKNFPNLRGYSWLFWTLALAGFFPVFLNLPMGQDAIPFLLLVTVAFLALKKDDPFKAGLLLGLASFKPQIVLPLLLIVMSRPQRGRLFTGFLLITGALTLVSAGISGWSSVLRYPRYLLEVNRNLGNGTITPTDMPNLRGLMAVLGADRIWQIVVACVSVALIVIAGRMWRKAKESWSLDEAFSFSVIFALLVGYHTHIYDMALLILPIALRFNAPLRAADLHKHAMELFSITVLFFTPLYLFLIGHALNGLLAIPIFLFGLSLSSGGKDARANINPSMGI